jgi:CDP-L-myo-inositol myo-inositolphosphotransferase
MQCVILAAGEGSRLDPNGDLKPLFSVAGLPLVERAVVTAHRAGATDIHVVTGYRAPEVEAFLADLTRRRGIPVQPLRNLHWQDGNGRSVLCARDEIDEPFLLLMADHVLDEAILHTLAAEPITPQELILAVDRGIADHDDIDLDDVTRVRLDGTQIVDIGKGIPRFDAYDTGAFLCSPALFDALEESIAAGDCTLSGGVRRLAARGTARVVDVNGHYWVDVDTPADAETARALLYATLVKPHDGFIARTINRRISLNLLTPLLLRLFGGITANQVTLLSFLVAGAATGFFFAALPLLGGIAVQLTSVLDGSDGEIARLKKQESDFGRFFDAVVDRYADAIILFSMFYFAWTSVDLATLLGSTHEPVVLGAGLLAIAGNLMVSYTSAKSVADLGYAYQGRWIASGRGRDLRLFLLFLGGVLAVVHPITVLLALVVIAALTNAIVLQRLRISHAQTGHPNPFAGVPTSAIVLDFDGTVADTMPTLTALATRLITERYHIPTAAAHRRYRDTTGLDFASQLERLFPNHSANLVVAGEFEAAKRDEILQRPVFPEVRSALAFFRARGLQVFLCSSTTADLVAAYVERHGLADYLDATTGFRPGFSKDVQIARLLAAHDIPPEEAVFIGDSLSDGAFARMAGVRFLGLHRVFTSTEFRTRGFRSAADLAAITRLWTKARDFQPSTPKTIAIRPSLPSWSRVPELTPPVSAPHPSAATPRDRA